MNWGGVREGDCARSPAGPSWAKATPGAIRAAGTAMKAACRALRPMFMSIARASRVQTVISGMEVEGGSAAPAHSKGDGLHSHRKAQYTASRGGGGGWRRLTGDDTTAWPCGRPRWEEGPRSEAPSAECSHVKARKALSQGRGGRHGCRAVRDGLATCGVGTKGVGGAGLESH